MMKFLTYAGIFAVLLFLFRGNSGGKVAFPNRLLSVPTPVSSVPPSERIRVVLFTGTEWCPACVHLDSTVVSHPDWKEFASKEIQFQIVDIPADRSKASESNLRMASRHSVRAYPTMIVLDRSGKALSRQAGSGAPVENYKAWIRKHANFY